MQKRYSVRAFLLFGILGLLLTILSAPHYLEAQSSAPASSTTESCVSERCHATMGKDKVVHNPVKEGVCTMCHRAVNDPQNKTKHPGGLLITLVKEGNALCFQCHPDKENAIKTKKVVHFPVKQSCTQCHNPHGSASPFMLSAPVPDVCSGCHPNEVMMLQRAITKHGPMSDQKSCGNCHDPHFTDQPRLLLTNERALCLACHNKELETGTGKIKDLKRFLDANKGGQGPLKGKPCGTCHNPHSSDYWRLLVKYYVPSFYSPYADGQYSLCFSCHEKEAFKVLRTTSATAKLTNFRDGDKNLHFIHVNKITKGRTCRTCHEVCSECQSTGLPKGVKESVMFSGWDMPINFIPNMNGGSCAPGCHGEKLYSR